MQVSQLTRRLTICSLLGVTALGMAVLPASASSAASASHAAFGTGSAIGKSSKPAVTIKGSPGTFSPTAVTAVSKKFKTCTQKSADLVLVNKTKTPKTITSGGSTLGVLAASSKGYICEYGPAGYVFTYGISGSTSTLSVTMS